jgi:hypothetical protein
MREIKGIELQIMPYKIKEFVGTLLFAIYPTTMVFSDEDGSPIIKEWVDCSDDNQIDRFFFYKTTNKYLKQFIDGEMSHLDLINSSLEDYTVFQDIQNDKTLRTYLLSLSLIPSDYKPDSNFVFDHKDGLDVNEIVSYFGLNDLNIAKTTIGLIKDISAKNNSETIYFKLLKGKGVGYGTVNTQVFGKTLINFDKLYKNVALDSLLGNSRGEISIDAHKNAKYVRLAETEIYGKGIAASYGFLIKPVSPPQVDLFNGETQTQNIATKAFNLINKSMEIETLKEEYLLHSGFTIRSYTDFLDGIIKSELNIELNWFSPFNKDEFVSNIDYKSANKIVNDISSLSTTNTSEVRPKGKFRSVNCDTGLYKFTSLNEEIYSGHCDNLIKDGLVRINFIDIYEVVISRKLIKEAGKKDEITINTLMSFYLDAKI